MLAVTGASAHGWLPSTGYAGPDDLSAMSAAIDDAAANAGRHPAEIRRLYNIIGSGGFPRGAPSEWAKQLAELTLTTGTSTYILSAATEMDLRAFAEDVAPAVRELVDAGRGRGPRGPQRTPTAATRPTSRPPAGTSSTSTTRCARSWRSCAT
jgi:hypothetical protein